MKTLYKLFIALSFLGLAACGSDDDECSLCSVDADCDTAAGLTCEPFSSGDLRCAYPNTQICAGP